MLIVNDNLERSMTEKQVFAGRTRNTFGKQANQKGWRVFPSKTILPWKCTNMAYMGGGGEEYQSIR